MSWTNDPDPDGRPVRPLGDGLDAVLRKLGAGAGQTTATIVRRWEDIVGPGVAAHARPLSLRGTTLVVAVDAPAYATQLRLLTPQLVARVTEMVGVGAVDSVEVRVRA